MARIILKKSPSTPPEPAKDLEVHASDAAYVSDNGPATQGDLYWNSATKKIRIYDGTNWVTVVREDENGDVVIPGNLTVDGTQTILNTETLEVEDVNITINNGGVQASADTAAGLTVEMSDATDVVLIYDDSTASKWKIGEAAAEAEVVTVSHTQTLTNKTIDADNNTLSNLAHGAEVDEPSSGVHGVTGSIVGTSDAQTLTNKTIDADNNTLSNLAHGAEVDEPSSGVHGVTGSIVGTSDAQTLTNKTIDGDLNTISNLAHGAEVDEPSSGVHGVTGSVVGTSDAQTLTSKTIDADNNTISNLAHGAEVDEPSSGVHGVTGSVVGTTDTQNISGKTFNQNLNSNEASTYQIGNSNRYAAAYADVGALGAIRKTDAVSETSTDFTAASSQAGEITYTTDFNQTVDISAFAWIKTTAAANQVAFAHTDTNGNNNKWWLQTMTTGVIRVIVSSDGTFNTATTVKDYRSVSTTVDDGNWHLIGFTFAADDLKLYVDAEEITGADLTISGSDPAINTLFASTTNLTIASLLTSGSPASFFDGNIDEVSYWSAALSADEVKELYNVGQPTNVMGHSKSANLVEWWTMGDDDDDTTSLIIGKVNENDATLTNTPTLAADAPGSSNTKLPVQSSLQLQKETYLSELASAPATPSSGLVALYALDTDSALRWKDSAGSEKEIAAVRRDVESFASADTIDENNDVALCSDASGAFTLNLRPAAQLTGKVFEIMKTNDSTDQVTIDGNGSETIRGETTFKLSTQYESIKIISDGTNWQLLEHNYPSVWTSYTPTGTWTTNTTYTGQWKRVGDTMEVQVKVDVDTGSPTAAALYVDIPSGYTIDTSKLELNSSNSEFTPVGLGMARNDGTGSSFHISVQYGAGDDDQVNLSSFNSSGTHSIWDAVNATSPTAFGDADSITVFFRVPITGWEG